ncbi:MAG TPA: SdrD B-like domain-containing protein [Methanothrix sp.]|nr:SdrD B-like domain-containing protein [Methanothrix sp.]
MVGYYDIDITFIKDVPYSPHTSPLYLYFCTRLSDVAHLWQGCTLHVKRDDGASQDTQVCIPEKTYCMGGRKINDCTGKGLSDWAVHVKNSRGTVYNAATDQNGYWQICNLSEGAYEVSEQLLPGWINVTPVSQTVIIDKKDVSGVNFRNFQLPCISGYKLDNCDKKGILGWNIILAKPDGSTEAATTNETGYYEFCGLLPGYYSLSEEHRDGWTTVSSPGSITLSCSNSVHNDFVNQALFCITGRKLDNCDGSGLYGWDITLTKPDGSTAIATTNETGYYEFCGLLPGVYSLSEEHRDGWTAVSSPGSINLDCENSVHNNFVNKAVLCISGYKLDDCGKTGIPGWNITLTKPEGSTATATTNETGYYEFCGLHPGEYSLSEESRDGWTTVFSPGSITLDRENSVHNNFVNQRSLSIEGRKIDGKNQTGLADWAVNLTASDGNVIETKTNETGYYRFSDLPLGAYTVCEATLPDWNASGDVCREVVLTCSNESGIDFVNFPVESNQTPEYPIRPEIAIIKRTNGDDANVLPGPHIPIGGPVNWTYEVTNTGNVTLTNVVVTDDRLGNIGTIPILLVNETRVLSRMGIAMSGQYVNNGTVSGEPPSGLEVNDTDISHYFGVSPGCSLILTKTADKFAAHRGEYINYTITLCNLGNCDFDLTNVTLWDVLPSGVELISVSREPSYSNLTWFIGTLAPGDCVAVELMVRVPKADINYDMSQEVQGEGFVNVHNDYNTHQGPESITNCAYARADLMETVSSCATTGIVDPKTEIKRREFGSGVYASEELTAMRTENKSISTTTSLSALHRPTTFSLPQGRSLDYATRWTEKSKGINSITGATMNEEYTFAGRIDKNRSLDLDENGSTMKTEVDFEGSGHIGALKKESPGAHPSAAPVYESSEDYVGRFRVFEAVDEYGSNVQSNRSVTGYGYAAVDKRIRGSQRTYESGTGSYQSDEIIDTPSSFVAKDISLVHGPSSFSYTPRVNVSRDMLWTEGMWSRSGYLAGGDILAGNRSCFAPSAEADGCNGTAPAASYISERYSSLEYLQKETVAAGLGEMTTNASFSGMADFRVKARGEDRGDRIDSEEMYVGQYDITRRVQLNGVTRYDRPHLTVSKEGNITSRWFNDTNARVAEYVITITNDGNRALAPINVRDVFPPGTEYIVSSIRPVSLSASEANWTLLHLGIGSSIELKLVLNVTDYAPCSLVNRVMVCGMNGEDCVSAAAYHAVDCGELPCCPPEVSVDKRAEIDASDPLLVHYTIAVKNNANSSIAATITDRLPAGLALVISSLEPNVYAGQVMQWIIPDLAAGATVALEYSARASADGRYLNVVQVDATAVDGSGYDTVEAASQVGVSSTGRAASTTRYGGWQPPAWNLTSPDGGISIDLSPQEDAA